MSYRLREAERDDMADIRDMIQELADFENMSEGPKITVEDLIRDGGFDDPSKAPLFHCVIAEAFDKNDANQPFTPVGYSFSYVSYSMWKGKTLFLEDLYVKPAHRRHTVGRQLFLRALRTCRLTACKALAFHVLSWNDTAKQFYATFDAINWTERSGQQFLRLEEPAIDRLLNEQGAGTSADLSSRF